MARQFTPKVVTANDLFSGDVIYLTAAGVWSKWHGDAELLLAEKDADARLQTAEGQPDMIVGPYLADAVPDENGTPVPVHFRELFRARGPSNYFLGKQAEQPGNV